MKSKLLSSLLLLSCHVFAACVPPERFIALEKPLAPQTFNLTPENEKQFPVQLVNFWALWCAPCRAELPLLKKISTEGIPVFLVNLGDNLEAANTFLTEISAQDLPRLHLENSDLLHTLGITGFPATFLLEDGVLRYRMQGALTAIDYEALIQYATCLSSS